MDIIVPIKQVPETGNVKMDPVKGTMVRDGVESIINPLDLYAIETAIRIREEHGGRVTAISMGPPNAEKSLKEAVAMGCDDGILVSDRKFSGSDTWSTSNILANAIKQIGKFDLIIAGERATDGDTGQVGPSIASSLDLPLATYISKIRNIHESGMVVERLVEEGYEILEIDLPALITVVKEISYPRLPTLRGKQRARSLEYRAMKAEDISVNEEDLGLKGSPTRVVKIETPKVTRGGEFYKALDEESIENAVNQLIIFLKEKELL